MSRIWTTKSAAYVVDVTQYGPEFCATVEKYSLSGSTLGQGSASGATSIDAINQARLRAEDNAFLCGIAGLAKL